MFRFSDGNTLTGATLDYRKLARIPAARISKNICNLMHYSYASKCGLQTYERGFEKIAKQSRPRLRMGWILDRVVLHKQTKNPSSNGKNNTASFSFATEQDFDIVSDGKRRLEITMAHPSTTKSWAIARALPGFDGLVLHQAVPIPKLGPHDVLVKFHYVSLNYRDVIIPQVSSPQYPRLFLELTRDIRE